MNKQICSVRLTLLKISILFLGLTSGCIGNQNQQTEPIKGMKSSESVNSISEQPVLSPYIYLASGRWVYVDNNKEIIFPRWYDSARPFNPNGLAGVEKANKVGFINKKGEEIIPLAFDRVVAPYASGVVVMEKDNEQSVYDTQGHTVVPSGQYEKFSEFIDGYALVQSKGKYGLIDSLGNEVLPLVYDDMVALRRKNTTALIGCYKGQLLRGGVAGFVNLKNEEVIPFKYDDIDAFSEGLAAVRENGGDKYGYIDAKGRWVIKPAFEAAYPFADGCAVVAIGGKKGAVDKKGKLVVPINYDKAANQYKGGVLAVYKNGAWGALGLNGDEVIPHRYDFLSATDEGLVIAGKAKKYGVLDAQGKVLIPLIYEGTRIGLPGLRIISDNLIRVKKDGKYGLVDRQHNLIAPIKYDKLAQYIQHQSLYGFIDVAINGQRAYIDTKGVAYFEE